MSGKERLINESTTGSSPGFFERAVRPVIAEFVAVTFFVFVGVCALVSDNLIASALAQGLTITLLILGLGEISGAHINPAVSVALMLNGSLSLWLLPGYIISQLAGAVLGAAIVRGTLPLFVYQNISGGVHHLGKFGPNNEIMVTANWGLLIEIVLTSVLVFTILMTAVDAKTKNPLAPLAIGFAVAVDVMAGGKLTGASMNPARSFGPALVASAVLEDAWTSHWIYWVGPILGAIAAIILYKLLFASPSSRWLGRRDM